MKKLNHLLSLLTCLLMLAAVALRRDGRFLGKDLAPAASQTDGTASESDFLTRLEDGTEVIDTTGPGREINGFSGPTPLLIHVRDGKVALLEALPNQDTPEFFSATLEEGFREQWYGKVVVEAVQTPVKPVTGATYSSTAFIQNVQAGLAAYLKASGESEAIGDIAPPQIPWRPSLKFVCGMLVALAAAVAPFFLRNKWWRMLQLSLNVAVLGCWCGVFVSHALMVKFLSQGMQDWSAVLPLLLLAMAFIYPFFGRKSHYCMQVCPFGSLQELAGKCSRKKLRISPQWLKRLEGFRQGLWAMLMLVMWCGTGFAWMDNEPFAAFLFRTAPPVALALAAVFTALSVFVPRPYCRFVCPTGSLLKFAEEE